MEDELFCPPPPRRGQEQSLGLTWPHAARAPSSHAPLRPAIHPWRPTSPNLRRFAEVLSQAHPRGARTGSHGQQRVAAESPLGHSLGHPSESCRDTQVGPAKRDRPHRQQDELQQSLLLRRAQGGPGHHTECWGPRGQLLPRSPPGRLSQHSFIHPSIHSFIQFPHSINALLNHDPLGVNAAGRPCV